MRSEAMRSRSQEKQLAAFHSGTGTALAAVAISLAVPLFRFAAFPRFVRWDAADFLCMGEWFSGKTVYFFSRQAGPWMIDARPPALPLLISIAFRLLGRSEFAGYMVSGILYGVGILGVYFLLGKFFSSKYSLLGTALFALNPVVFEWGQQLYTHVEVTTFMVWTLYVFMRAIDGNRRWFLLAFPLLFATVMMRYTGALIAVPIVVYAIASDQEEALRISTSNTAWPQALLCLLPHHINGLCIFMKNMGLFSLSRC